MASRRPTRREQAVIEAASRRAGINPATLWGVYGAETNFGANKNRSSAGAQGDFQIMPFHKGVDPYDFEDAANWAARYLAQYKSRGRKGALAAYNAGPAGNPNNPETAAYIPRVLQLAKSWAGGGGAVAASRAGNLGSTIQLPDITKTNRRYQLFDTLSKLNEAAGMEDPLAKSNLELFKSMAGPPTTTEPGLTLKVGGGGSTTPTKSGGKGDFRGGGGYAGTEGLAAALPTFGLRVTSRKRATQNTASGNPSDHWTGSKQAYAEDLSGSKAQMDAAFRKYEGYFGRKLKYNEYNNFTIETRSGNKIRVQVIYGPAVDHDDHIHVGFRRL